MTQLIHRHGGGLTWAKFMALAFVMGGCDAPQLPTSTTAPAPTSLTTPAAPSPAAPSAVASLTASDVMAQVKAKYRQCTTYVDHGVLTNIDTVPYPGGRITTANCDFKTRFQRDSGNFRLDWVETSPDETRTMWLVKNTEDLVSYDVRKGFKPRRQQHESLVSALHQYNAVTHGTGMMLPCLLTPEVNASAFWGAIANTQRAPDEQLDGVTCTRLTGSFRGSGSVDFWISPDHAIVKIQTVEEFGGGRQERTWTFNPQFDTPLDDASFDVAAISSP